MRPKTRWLAQHGGPPGWLEKSDPAGVILHRLPFPYLGVSLTEVAQLQTDGISGYCYIVNDYTTIRHELRHARKVYPMSWDSRKQSLSAEWKKNQCCGSGSGRIGLILPDTYREWYTEPPDKDPYPFKLKEKIN